MITPTVVRPPDPVKSPIPTAQPSVASTPPVVKDSESSVESPVYDLLVGLRLLQNGRFSGLWELVELENPSTETLKVKKVLTDANTKGQCAGIASRRFIQYNRLVKTEIPKTKPEAKK